MNYNQDRYDRDRDSYHTHRSERYRHPDQDMEREATDTYRPVDRNRVSYGNEFYRSSQRRSPKDWNPEHVANRGTNTYYTARNYGNMGSYGGAQGFGSERGGYPHHREAGMGSEFESGMGEMRYAERGSTRREEQPRRFGYLSDYDSHGQNTGSYQHDRGDRARSYTSGRYQDRSSYEPENYRSYSYGGDRGSYMGSGYERTPHSNEYGATHGDYGRTGQYMGRYSSNTYDEPYGMSGYYRGGYSDSDYNSYARDRDERNYDRY